VKDELQKALTYMGVMFVAVGLLGIIAGLRHGINGLAVLVGVFGIAMFVAGRFLARNP
jgi:hypothetical protein